MRKNTSRAGRRTFLKTAALAGLASPLSAIEPIRRDGSPRMHLALAAYSFRDSFIHNNRGKPAKKAGDAGAIEMRNFIDYCAKHGCAAELTGYFFPTDAKDTHYTDIRRHAFLRGVAVSGTAVGNNFALPEGEKRDSEIAYVRKVNYQGFVALEYESSKPDEAVPAWLEKLSAALNP